MNDENKITDCANAIAAVAKEVPIYPDAIQPAAQEVGKGLKIIAQTVNVALAPLKVLIWGYDQIEKFVQTKVAERLKHLPPEDIISPKPNVAGPALEALRFTGHDESLSDLYANLLAAAMTKDIAKGAHPSFVDIIKQLTSDEAKLLRFFARNRTLPLIDLNIKGKGNKGSITVVVNYSLLGQQADCEFPEMTPSYINNLCRLGLGEIPAYSSYTNLQLYMPLETTPFIVKTMNEFKDLQREPFIERKRIEITELGNQFIKICVLPTIQSSPDSYTLPKIHSSLDVRRDINVVI